MGLRKNVVGTLPSPKNIYFRICLQYYAWDFEKNAIDTRPPPKKKMFAYDYSG